MKTEGVGEDDKKEGEEEKKEGEKKREEEARKEERKNIVLVFIISYETCK